MKDLLSLQDAFQAYLLDDTHDLIANSIVTTEKVPAELRLNIYGNAYRARMLEALESTYPVLKTCLGEDEFYQLGLEYLAAYPSTFRSIRWFGHQLPDFLRTHAEYISYTELALLEWTMSLVFDAAFCDLMTVDDMAQLPGDAWETLQIQFIPSVYQLRLFSNAFAIWQAVSDGLQPPQLTYTSVPVHWLLWRQGLLNHYASQAEDEAFMVASIMKKQTFGMICEGLCQWMDEEDAVNKAVLLLKGWIISGIIKRM